MKHLDIRQFVVQECPARFVDSVPTVWVYQWVSSVNTESGALMLTDKAIQASKPRSRPYKLADGEGLTLLVKPNGRKLWRFRYRHQGREKMLAFSVYPETRPIRRVTIAFTCLAAAFMVGIGLLSPFLAEPGQIPIEWKLLIGWGLCGWLVYFCSHRGQEKIAVLNEK